MPNSIANGYGFSCNAPDNTNNVTSAWRSFNANIITDKAAAADTILYYAGAGNPITDKYWAFYARNLRSFFGGGVHSNTYTTEGGTAGEPKIELSTNAATISKGGQTRATFGAGGQLLKLADILFYAVQYGLIVNPSVPATCTNSFFSFRSSPNLTTKTATLYHVCSYNRDGVRSSTDSTMAFQQLIPVRLAMSDFVQMYPLPTMFYADQPGVPSLFKGDIRCNTYKTVDGASTDADIQLSNNVQLTARSDTGVIKCVKSGSSNDTNYTLTQHGGSWNTGGVFSGGYQFHAQNAWFATDWLPEEGAIIGERPFIMAISLIRGSWATTFSR